MKKKKTNMKTQPGSYKNSTQFMRLKIVLVLLLVAALLYASLRIFGS